MNTNQRRGSMGGPRGRVEVRSVECNRTLSDWYSACPACGPPLGCADRRHDHLPHPTRARLRMNKVVAGGSDTALGLVLRRVWPSERRPKEAPDVTHGTLV